MLKYDGTNKWAQLLLKAQLNPPYKPQLWFELHYHNANRKTLKSSLELFSTRYLYFKDNIPSHRYVSLISPSKSTPYPTE